MLTWTAPAALWLLAAVPLVWLAHAVARTNFNPRQRWLQAGVRSLILIALAAALARPMMATSSSRESIVYAVDVSYSVSGNAIEAAAGRIDTLNASLRPSHFRIVAFGATAAALDGTAALRQLAHMDPRVRPLPRPRLTGKAPTSKQPWARPAPNWRLAPFRASCCSPTVTRLPETRMPR